MINPNEDKVRIRLRTDSPYYVPDRPDIWVYQDFGVQPDAEYLVRFVDEYFVYINQEPIASTTLMERRPCYGIVAMSREDYDFEVVR